MGSAEVLTAPRSPWQNPFAERLIGTIRRELLNHVIVLNEGHLRRRLRSYLRYYHGSRTHLALEKDAKSRSNTQTYPSPAAPCLFRACNKTLTRCEPLLFLASFE